MSTEKKAFILVVIFIFIAIVLTKTQTNDLKNNGIILNGLIHNLGHSGKSGSRFYYKFSHNKVEISDSYPIDIKYPKELVGKFFPVLFSTKTSKSALLVTPSDFKRYNIPFPDSLNWVKDYVKKW